MYGERERKLTRPAAMVEQMEKGRGRYPVTAVSAVKQHYNWRNV